MKSTLLIIGLLCTSVSHSYTTPTVHAPPKHTASPVDYVPLYAGTLLAFFSTNVPPGQLDVEPYLTQTIQSGFYDENWAPQGLKNINELSISLLLETGITSWLDISIFATETYNQISNHQTLLYKDTQASLGFQILLDEKGKWTPDLRFVLGENFPTGRYQDLNPQKQLSDSGGTGSYQTFFILVGRKIFYTIPNHPFNININLEYITSIKTNVSGLNVYGGSPFTKGTISPGGQYVINLAMEFNLTRNWVLGTDIHYIHQNKTTFSGNSGEAPIGLPSLDQFSLAPCIEYNYNENFGILAGTWFTVAGRNSSKFISNIFSVYYVF